MTRSPRETVTARRLEELRRSHPADATLQNLLTVLSAKLDLCGRLPVFEYEAVNEGHEQTAEFFRELGGVERRTFDEVLVSLRGHLDARRLGSNTMPTEPAA